MNAMAVVETIARILEYIGVLVISITFVHALLRAIPHVGRMTVAVYSGLKIYMGYQFNGKGDNELNMDLAGLMVGLGVMF
jgi:hypothetical protein